MNVTKIGVPAIYAVYVAALRLRINISGVRRILKHPESVAAEHRLPLRVADATPITGLARIGAVVLQAAINLVGFGVVDADVVELRYRKVAGLPPLGAA